MLSASKLDATLKANYLHEHPPSDGRISTCKRNAGFIVPEIFSLARAGKLAQLKKILRKNIENEKSSACVDMRCSVTGRTLLHEAVTFEHKVLTLLERNFMVLIFF